MSHTTNDGQFGNALIRSNNIRWGVRKRKIKSVNCVAYSAAPCCGPGLPKLGLAARLIVQFGPLGASCGEKISLCRVTLRKGIWAPNTVCSLLGW